MQIHASSMLFRDVFQFLLELNDFIIRVSCGQSVGCHRTGGSVDPDRDNSIWNCFTSQHLLKVISHHDEPPLCYTIEASSLFRVRFIDM